MFEFDAVDKHSTSLCPDKSFTPTALSAALGSATKGNSTHSQHIHATLWNSQPGRLPGLGSSHSSPHLSPKPFATGGIPESGEPSMSSHGTPPIDIVLTPSETRSRSRARKDENERALAEPTPRIAPFTGKSGRKKKRVAKKGAIAALSTVRGFTPATSGDEDSDFPSESFRRRRELSVQRSSSIVRKDFSIDCPSSVVNGQGVRSSSPSGGISALTKQLDALECDQDFGTVPTLKTKSKLRSENASNASATSGTSGDEDIAETTSYEVPLEHDFISPDVALRVNGSSRQNTITGRDAVRKMEAADFEPLRCLGKGTYGTVLLVKQQSTGRLYAQKQFRKASLTVRKQLVEQTKTERNILESINRHPFVVKLYYAFQDHEKLYLILEYAQGGELFERMRTERMFPEETAAFYMAEMVLALEHLHHNVGVVYRDLKPENCLLDAEGHLLLTDFGLSKVAVDGEHQCRSMTGTVEYMAPEVIQMQSYGTAVDWWSFGILGFDLLTGSSPFRANNDFKIKEKILKAKLVLPYFVSADAKDLLTRLLRKEPRKRLGACMPKDMQIIKNHRFFRKIQWTELERRELEPPIKPLITDPELAENFSPEFTDLAMSPVVGAPLHAANVQDEHDPFGGFSFVGSRSLLESEGAWF